MKDNPNVDSKLNGWARLMSCTAHDLTTPLVTIRLSAQALEGILPKLFEGYRIAVAQNLIEPLPMDEAHFKFIEYKAIENIENVVTQVIKRLQFTNEVVKQFTLASPDELEVFSMKACIESLLKTYPFENEAQCKLIHLDLQQDFKFKGVRIFVEHMLGNFLNNALYYIKYAERGEVYISITQEANWNILRFKDTGPGISESRLPDVFYRFFSEREDGVKIGLGFCRHVLRIFGGELECASIEGEFTEFTVKLPKL